ncbi:HpaII family restriction endonuclease [Colwellia sp. RE-S-Sl-9]
MSFLKESRIQSLNAKSADKSDITIQIHDQFTGSNPILGFSVKSMLGQKSTLFNAGPGTNFIFNVEGLELATVDIKKINIDTYQQKNKIGERFNSIESLGGGKFKNIQSEILQLNLGLIDGDLPEILAYMLKIRFQTGNNRVNDLIEHLELKNPLSYNQLYDHPFYRYKIIRFLYDTALGMTPETVWNGEIKANGGIIVVKNDGDILAYHTYHKSKFEDYLLNNTCLEQPATSEDENDPGTEMTKDKYPDKKNIKNFKFGWLYVEDEPFHLKFFPP